MLYIPDSPEIIKKEQENIILTTMSKDCDYYKEKMEKLSEYIKQYFNEFGKYPESRIEFYLYGRQIGHGAFGKVIFSLNNMNYIEDSLNELASSPKVVVYYGVPCCGTLCSCCCTCVGSEGCCSCGDYYQYSTLSVKNGSKNYLFKNVVKLYCCDICCCSDKKRRLKYCKSYAVNSYEQFLSKEAGVLTNIMENENKCLCCIFKIF